MITAGLESKLNAAYQHGRMDFRAGTPCKPETPLVVYGGLSELQRNIVMQTWVDGWLDESKHKGDGNG